MSLRGRRVRAWSFASVSRALSLGLALAGAEARAEIGPPEAVEPAAAEAAPATDPPASDVPPRAKAPAEGEIPVVVLPVRVEGELPDARRVELRTALEAGLRRGGFGLVPPPEASTPCQTIPCQAQVARGVGAEYAVSMRVVVERRDYAITIDVVAAADDARVAQSAERCEVCGFTEVAQVVDSQAAAIVARLDALALEPPVLVFESVPAGAVIRVDDQVVGQAPFERVVEPGLRRVQADQDGYVSEQRSVEAVAGVRATVRFELEPVPRPERRKRLRALGWAALGIGVAGVATGIPLIVIDGRENQASCSGDNVDPLGNCKYLYATREAGIAVTVVGGALLAAGIGIVVATRRGKRSARAALGGGPRGLLLRGWF